MTPSKLSGDSQVEPTADYDIAIVGGGMVGATLACLIRDCGQRVVLIDAAAAPQWDFANDSQSKQAEYDLRVSALGAAAQTTLTAAGIWPLIAQQRHCAYSRMVVWDECGSGRLTFDVQDAPDGQVTQLGHIIENRILNAAGWHVLQSSDVTLMQETAVTAFARCGQGWQLTLANGDKLHTALLIGADGARSRVRAAAGIHHTRRDYGQQGIVATIRTQQSNANAAWQRFLHNGPLALLPLDDHHCSIVWSTTVAESKRLLALSDADFSAELTRMSDFVLGELEVVSQRVAFPLHAHDLQDYVQPQLALVGDAAHSIHPLAGQGVNLGFKDVSVLAELINTNSAAGQITGLDTAQLRRYARTRKFDNMAMLGLTDVLARASSQQNGVMRRAMNAGMNVTELTQPLKQFFLMEALG